MVVTSRVLKQGDVVAVRMIHVGLGNWGQNWESQVLPTVSDDVQTVAFVDAHPETMEAARSTLALPENLCFASLDEAMEEVSADAVLATVPLEAHVPVALSALNAGKHVLIEKPFAPSVADAQEVINAATAGNLVAMVSQNYRFYPAVRAARGLVAEQIFGRVGSVNIDFRRHATPRPGSAYAKIPHPLLEDMAIHHFDLMRAVLDQEPVSVYCNAWNPGWSGYAGITSASASVTFDGGANVSYRGSWVSPGPPTSWAGEWRIECEGGEIVWTSRANNRGLEAERVKLRPVDGPEKDMELPRMEHWGRAGVLQAFAKAIQDGDTPETAVSDNISTLALTAAIITSAESHAPVVLR